MAIVAAASGAGIGEDVLLYKCLNAIASPVAVSAAPMPAPPLAIALLSGGLDSATAAALAIEAGYQVIGLSLDYGQRHRRELQAAAELAPLLGLAEHHTIAVNLAAWGGSALTDTAIAVPSAGVEAGVIPSTYVPGRNTVFIALALSLAEARGAEKLVLGVNAVDYSGYPDCRPDYLEAFQSLAELASKAGREGRGIGGQVGRIDHGAQAGRGDHAGVGAVLAMIGVGLVGVAVAHRRARRDLSTTSAGRAPSRR